MDEENKERRQSNQFSQAEAASKVQDALPKATISIQPPAPMVGDGETTRHSTDPAGALQIADVFLMKVGEKANEGNCTVPSY